MGSRSGEFRLNRGLLFGSAATLALLGGPALADDLTEEQKTELKNRLEVLKERLQQLEDKRQPEATRTSQERVAPAQAVTAGEFPGSWKLPGTDTSLSFSGYVKVDAFYTIGRPHVSPGGAPAGGVGDSFIVSSIPVDGTVAAGQSSDFRIHAKRSRLRFDTRTPTDWGSLRTRVEGDFSTNTGNERFSNSDQFRLRQAFGQLGPVLGGQTQSTFNDDDTFPDLLDPGGPAGETDVRQAQIRYTYAADSIAKGMGIDVAIENPEQRNVRNVANAQSLNTNFVDRAPDFVTRLRYRSSWGAVNIAGVLRRFEYSNGVGDNDSLWSGAGRAGVTINTWGKDNIKLSGAYGPGLGRYMDSVTPETTVTCTTPIVAGSLSVTPGCGANLTTDTSWGTWGSYTHYWLDSLRSNLVLGYSQWKVDVAKLGNAAAGLPEETATIHANLIWNPVPRVAIGFEMIWGWRENAFAIPPNDKGGQAGRALTTLQYFF